MNLTANSKYLKINIWQILFLIIFLPLLLLIASNSPQIMWNSVRSFYAVAAFNGLSTYPGIDGIGIFGQYYPPLGWLIYSPIGVFENPTSVILSASILNISFTLIALFSVFIWTNKRTKGMAFILFTLSIWLLVPTTFYIISMVHIDAPALALLILSCCILERNKSTLTPAKLFFAALLLSTSIWVKQVMVFALCAQLLIVSIRHTTKDTIIYLCFVAMSVLCIGLLMSSLYGWDQLTFHMFELPSRTQYLPLITTASKIVIELFPLIIVCSVIIIISSKVSLSENKNFLDGLKEQFIDSEYAYYLLIAFSLVPISFLARMRYGGDINSLICIPFFILSTSVSIQQWYAANRSNLNKILAASVLFVLISTTAISVGLSHPSNTLKIPVTTAWHRVFDNDARKLNPSEQAFDYIKSSSAKPYFPLYPIASWLAQKEVSPYSIAQCERELILGLSEEKDRFVKALKQTPTEILYFRTDQQHCDKSTYIHQKYFPDIFTIKQNSELMPGWDIFKAN